MSVSASGLRDEIIAFFPGDWSWLSGQANYAYLDALCSGFATMWAAGILSLSTQTGPPTPPSGNFHDHTILTLVAATMSGPAEALNYTGAADTFVQAVAAETATHLKATTLATVDGTSLHDHGFTFESATDLKNAILEAISFTGTGIVPFVTAFSNGLIAHMSNAAMVQGLGIGHTHAVS